MEHCVICHLDYSGKGHICGYTMSITLTYCQKCRPIVTGTGKTDVSNPTPKIPNFCSNCGHKLN